MRPSTPLERAIRGRFGDADADRLRVHSSSLQTALLHCPTTTVRVRDAAFMQALHDPHSLGAVSAATYKATRGPERELPNSSQLEKPLVCHTK